MKKACIVFIVILIISNVPSAFAQVIMPSFISDNMVLQQQTDAPLWGKAKSGADITLTCSWDNSIFKTKTDAGGKWKLNVKTPKAAGPYTITVKNQNS